MNEKEFPSTPEKEPENVDTEPRETGLPEAPPQEEYQELGSLEELKGKFKERGYEYVTSQSLIKYIGDEETKRFHVEQDRTKEQVLAQYEKDYGEAGYEFAAVEHRGPGRGEKSIYIFRRRKAA